MVSPVENFQVWRLEKYHTNIIFLILILISIIFNIHTYYYYINYQLYQIFGNRTGVKSQGGKDIREIFYHIIGKYKLVASQAVDIFKSLDWRFNVVALKIDGEY